MCLLKFVRQKRTHFSKHAVCTTWLWELCASLWLIGPCGFCPRYAHNFTDQSDVSNYPMVNESGMTCFSYWFLSCWLLSCCGGWTRVWIKWFSNDATFLANVRTYSQLRTSIIARTIGSPASQWAETYFELHVDEDLMRGFWLAMTRHWRLHQ